LSANARTAVRAHKIERRNARLLQLGVSVDATFLSPLSIAAEEEGV
jgi:hypothetical protein